MFGAMNKRQMEKMMKQMGIKSDEIPAERVTIHCKDKDLVIESPQVTKVSMGGQETYQVIGEAKEKQKKMFSNEDVNMIVQQTGASMEEARKALEETNDIAEAIVKIKG